MTDVKPCGPPAPTAPVRRPEAPVLEATTAAVILPADPGVAIRRSAHHPIGIRRARWKRVRVDTGGSGGYDSGMEGNGSQPSDEVALKQAMGRALAHARVEAGFATQAAFSQAIDVRFQYMSRVEKGEENLTLETLAKMTGVLGIAMPDFLSSVAQEMRDPSEPPATRRGRRPAG